MLTRKPFTEFKTLVMIAIASIVILSLIPFLFWNTYQSSAYLNILTIITSFIALVFLVYGTYKSYKNYKDIFKPLLFFTTGIGLYFFANIFYFIVEEIIGSSSLLSAVNLLYSASYPFLFVSVFLFAKRPFKIRYKELFDVSIIVVSIFFIVWFPFVWPVVETGSPDTLSMVLSLSYLFLDLMLSLSVLLLLFNENRRIPEPPIVLIYVGIFFQILGDMAYAYYAVNPLLSAKWLFSVLYSTNSIFIMLAVTSFLKKVNIDIRQWIDAYRIEHPHNDLISYLPLLLVLGAYGLLIVTKPDAALIWGVGLIVVMVLLRQIILLNETKKAQMEQEKAEIALKESLKEKESLLREIHHRVKNNLQIILSLLSLQSKNVVDEKDKELFKGSQNQVRSMALIHEKLYESDNLSAINFSEYIKSLLNSIMDDYPQYIHLIDLNVDIEDIKLNIETSVPCGLIINELVSNSLKHAFTPGRKGNITIKMYSDNDDFILTVADDGIGYDKKAELLDNANFGLKLVDVLVKQLDGSLEHLEE
ncbi:MAG: hypothetical protein KO275_07800, partial [Methanobacterium sp.]|nr:hypothetical protein [Methanobacterium sp.]